MFYSFQSRSLLYILLNLSLHTSSVVKGIDFKIILRFILIYVTLVYGIIYFMCMILYFYFCIPYSMLTVKGLLPSITVDLLYSFHFFLPCSLSSSFIIWLPFTSFSCHIELARILVLYQKVVQVDSFALFLSLGKEHSLFYH